ncbi:alpha/beta hydrolase-fold protein [Prosthecobacter sp.]|uniref:alpha/beta hydrolase n=1 Tax=Prosthecobacter sp. TaxID=1965333 RepID=UPI001D4D71E4|nr:alpha/beta hydrolase-fold protein [Prosthecobacter sp.]MCB1276285.1 esterase family protein [Prosthecobacter sp.]
MTAHLLPVLLAALIVSAHAVDDYKLGPLSQENPGVPKGKVIAMPAHASTIYPGTTRDWWIYVPAQYKPEQPANLMVFQDGHDYVGVKGAWRVPVVFDNLIASGDMPPIIAIFINPGHSGATKPPSAWKNNNRGKEYNTLGDVYARFLLEEIIPQVQKDYKLTDDPEGWAIAGASSGAICAFTVAWERPDKFRKVFSTIGSYVDLAGGHVYPSLIRLTERKPLRIYLQDGSSDLDNPFGNWPIANQQMARALAYQKYDFTFTFGDGAHNSKHGASLFPEAMKWLWRR